jgi:hypothetical protein
VRVSAPVGLTSSGAEIEAGITLSFIGMAR